MTGTQLFTFAIEGTRLDGAMYSQCIGQARAPLGCGCSSKWLLY
jgi:hypothetical protein